MATQTTKVPEGGKESGAARKPRRSILGKKLGMTQIFNEVGHWVPVTVVHVGPCTVLQVKTPEKDGYSAIQLGFDDTKKKKKKPQQAFLEKIGVTAKRFVREVPFLEVEAGSGGSDGPPVIGPGTKVGVSFFKDVKRVDIRARTKGRGFQGVIRRHHFNAGPKSRGTKNIRESGSTGMHTDPGRVHKGKKMPGHMGAVLRKARNLDVVKIDEEANLLLVRGSVPGPSGGYLFIQESLR